MRGTKEHTIKHEKVGENSTFVPINDPLRKKTDLLRNQFVKT